MKGGLRTTLHPAVHVRHLENAGFSSACTDFLHLAPELSRFKIETYLMDQHVTV